MCRKSVEDKTIEINAQLDRDRIKICPQKNFPISFPYFRKNKEQEKRQTQLGEKLYETWSEFYNYILFKVTIGIITMQSLTELILSSQMEEKRECRI